MDIGKEIETIIVEPTVIPVPQREERPKQRPARPAVPRKMPAAPKTPAKKPVKR